MRRILLSVLLLLVPAALRGQLASDMKSKIDGAAKAFVKEHTVPGLIVGIIAPDPNNPEKTVREIYYYGTAPQDRRPNARSLFRIASLTKVFTATLLAYFVEKGKVELNDPIQPYFPQIKIPSYGDRKITFVDLATHTSGLPDMPGNFRNYNTYTMDEMYRFLNRYTLAHPPGSVYLYSNFGFALLGAALENLTKASWEELVVTHICDPLDMPDTRAILTPEQEQRAVTGHSPTNRLQPFNQIKPRSGDPLEPAGGLFSTMKDMLNFLSFNMGLSGDSSLLPILQNPERPMARKPNQIGLGWEIMPLGKNINRFSKNGLLGGYSSFICFAKESKTGVVVLCDKQQHCDLVGIKALRILNGLSVKN